MPKGRRAAALVQYKRQDARNYRAPVRSRAERVLANGVGAYPSRAFGSVPGYSLCGWDAFHPMHIPLPRGVGPYTVLRTTVQVKSASKAVLFAPFQFTSQAGNTFSAEWTNIVGVALDAKSPLDTSINQKGKIESYRVTSPLGSVGGRCVPSALSVQILNPGALQTTSGIVTAAVCSAQVDWGGTSLTWNKLMGGLMSFMRPRLMSAGKLALRGIQMNSYPLNMDDVSNFTSYNVVSDGGKEIDGTWSDGLAPRGWAPMAVLNNDGVELTYLITVEWRARFPMDNAAVSTHVHHKVTPDNTWNNLISKAVSLGNGVVDIVESVANVGNAVGGMAQAASRAIGRPPQAMLVD